MTGKVSGLGLAKALSLGVTSALLAAAFGSEYIGGLNPCEMCWGQRWAQMGGVAFALIAIAGAGRLPDRGRSFVWLAALAILASGLIGVYHAGVEAGIFEGVTQCSGVDSSGSAEDVLNRIMNAPIIRCDQVQWRLFGISMAGWNAILSVGSALVMLWLSL